VIRSSSASVSGTGRSSFTLSFASAAPTIVVNDVTFKASDSGTRALVFAEVGSASDPEGNAVDVVCSPAIGTALSVGAHSITCTATDDDDLSTSDSGTVTIAADLSPPTADMSLSPSATTAGWNRSSVVVTLTASDARSSITSITYKAAGAQSIVTTTVGGHSATVSITVPGITNLTFRARDAAGNFSPWMTRAVRIDTTLPSNSSPRIILRNRMNGDGSVPFSIIWSASDAQSGLSKTTLQLSVELGSFAPLALPSATAVTASVTLHDGATYQFRTRSRDRAGNDSRVTSTQLWHTGQRFALDVMQNNDSSGAVTYAGDWSTSTGNLWFGGTTRAASSIGSSVSVEFTGTSVAWIAALGSNRGQVSISLDGNPVVTAANPLDLYRAVGSSRDVVFQRTGLTNTAHTLVITVVGSNSSSTGTRIEFDGLVVTRPS